MDKKKKINFEIRRLRKEDPYTEESNEGTRNVDELGDDVMEDIGHDETIQKIDELNNSLLQIEKALEAIKNGTYGIDEETKEPISLDRLKVYPEATTAS